MAGLTPQDRAVLDMLHRVTSQLPEVEERPGQDEMTISIARAIAAKRHRRTGWHRQENSGYLVPVILRQANGSRDIHKTLQDQLAMNDLFSLMLWPMFSGTTWWAVLGSPKLRLRATNQRDRFIRTGST